MPKLKPIQFDGYCPESKLRGKIVECQINDMDFWESPATGLQITTFAPYAAILNFRGVGKFKMHQQRAGKLFEKGLVLTKAKTDAGEEIFPDEKAIFYFYDDLDNYLRSL